MGLTRITERPRKVYLSVSEGKISHSEQGKKTYFASVEGYLERIYRRDREFNGETVPYWYIDLRDRDTRYSLSLPYRSGVFTSIVLALASAKGLTLSPIKIEPYQKNGYTKVTVSLNGERLDWITKEIPPVEEKKIGAEKYKDYSKRMEFIEGLVARINQAAGAEK